MCLQSKAVHITVTTKFRSGTLFARQDRGTLLTALPAKEVLARHVGAAFGATDMGAGTALVLVSNPLTSAEGYDGATIADDMSGVNALIRHKVLPLSAFVAKQTRTRQFLFRAVFGNMQLDTAARHFSTTSFVRTADFDVVAHVFDESRGFPGDPEMIAST